MFNIEINDKYSKITYQTDNSVASISNPIYLIDDNEFEIDTFSCLDDQMEYYDDFFHVYCSIEEHKNGVFEFSRQWKNITNKTIKFQTIFRVSPLFNVNRYLIPCVSMNGNVYGNGKEPKGTEYQGEKWIFAYDRTSIPSCSLTENNQFALTIYANNISADSLVSSCSVWKDDKFHQEIIHPNIESPITYSTRDGYGEKSNSFITLAPGESFTESNIVFVSIPRWENYGIGNVIEYLTEKTIIPYDNQINENTLWNASIKFAKSLINDYKGIKGFMIGFIPDDKDGFLYRQNDFMQLGWCGQNALFARMLVEDFVKYKNFDSLLQALKILDDRMKYGVGKNGLLFAQIKEKKNTTNNSSDTCNMGYGCYEILRTYELLKENNIDKKEYLKAGISFCDFFLNHFSDEYGFGKVWSHDGECIDQGGTIGVFIVPALAKAYKLTRDFRYLDLAEKALDFYVKRDLNNFCCTAGALDTCCVDKETSAPILISSILLFEITKDNKFIEYAEKAAYYFTSWMYFYNPIYDSHCDFSQYNINTIGLTAVSTQHHHLDPYGSLIVPYLLKLSEYSRNNNWGKVALLMWRSSIQCVSTGKEIIHGHKRPIGSQNEAYFHCNWGFGDFKKGGINDWLVAWPCAFRLSVLSELSKFRLNNKHTII